MKKVIALFLSLACLLTLSACGRKSMNYIIANKPSIRGAVTQTADTAILVKNGDGEYWVSLDVENRDSMTHFQIGDEVAVYYDGSIAETSPMQINKVYAISLVTPADRADNDQS